MDCDDQPTPYTPESLAAELAPMYDRVVRVLKDAISRGNIMTVKALTARFPDSHTEVWDSEELCDPTPYTQCMQGGHFGVLEHLCREDLVSTWVLVEPLARTLCSTAVNVERVIQFMEAVQFDLRDVEGALLGACARAPGLELLKYVIRRFNLSGEPLACADGPLVRASGRLDVVAYLCPMLLGCPRDVLADLAATGDLCVVQHVCEYFARTGMGRKDGLDMLRGAARGGQVATMVYLDSKFKLSRGGVVEDPGLVKACAGGHLDAVKFLCDTFKLTVADVERGDGAALQAAAAGGHLAVVTYLCKNYELTAGRGAFAQAVKCGHVAVAEKLHTYKLTGTNVREGAAAALPTACELGNAGMVHFLCERFRLTLQDVGAHTSRALAAAAAQGCLDIVTYLCEHLRLAGEGDGVWSGALWAAAGAGHLAVVQYVCNHFVLTSRDLCLKRSRAVRRAAEGHLAVVVYLCERGAADGDAAARALRVATKGGHLNVARYLCARFDLPPDKSHEGLCAYLKLASEYASTVPSDDKGTQDTRAAAGADTPALTLDDVSALRLLDVGAAPLLTPRMERIRDALGARRKRKRVSVDLTRELPVESCSGDELTRPAAQT
jgi:hypothetical protein